MAERIRILRIIGRLNVGGPSVHVILLHTGMDATRFEDRLVIGRENPDEGSMVELARAAGITPTIVPEMVGSISLRLRDVLAVIRLYRIIRAFHPDIVETHTTKAGVLGRLAARLAGVPVIVHVFHGHVLEGYFRPTYTLALRLMERVLARLTDRILTVSERVRAELVRYGVAPEHRIDVMRLGVELGPYRTGDAHRGAFRREIGVPPDARLIGCVGRLVPVKNHLGFLDAAASIVTRVPAVRFVVVGDGPLRHELRAHSRRVGLEQLVTFAGWRRDLPQVYSDLDVLVVPSRNEGTPLVAIEAMAAGCAVVATDVGGLPDIVRSGQTGVLVPPNDAAALADAVVALLEDDATRQRLGESARAASAAFDIRRLRREMEAFYVALVEATPAGVHGHSACREGYR